MSPTIGRWVNVGDYILYHIGQVKPYNNDMINNPLG